MIFQVTDWLRSEGDSYLESHVHYGENASETEELIEIHGRFEKSFKVKFSIIPFSVLFCPCFNFDMIPSASFEALPDNNCSCEDLCTPYIPLGRMIFVFFCRKNVMQFRNCNGMARSLSTQATSMLLPSNTKLTNLMKCSKDLHFNLTNVGEFWIKLMDFTEAVNQYVFELFFHFHFPSYLSHLFSITLQNHMISKAWSAYSIVFTKQNFIWDELTNFNFTWILITY